MDFFEWQVLVSNPNHLPSHVFNVKIFFVLVFRSVDGRVRRYDLRMGQLHEDFIDS